MAKAKATESGSVVVEIKPPNFKEIKFHIVGTAPLLVNRFPAKAKQEIREKQEAGSTAATRKRPRAPKDFDALYEDAFYQSKQGWYGIHAASLRNAMIACCRLTDIEMTIAKLCLFIRADGFDAKDGTPLVRLWGEPTRDERMAQPAYGGPDIRVRARFDEWSMTVRVRYDADRFSAESVTALLMRAGMQCGLADGRPFSKKSNGIGMGTFEIAAESDGKKAKVA